MKRFNITPERMVLIIAFLSAIFVLFIPFALKNFPDFASGNVTVQLVREDVNITAAYLLLALIPFVTAGWIWLYIKAGRKSDSDKKLEELEKKIDERFDTIDKKLGIVKESDIKVKSKPSRRR